MPQGNSEPQSLARLNHDSRLRELNALGYRLGRFAPVQLSCSPFSRSSIMAARYAQHVSARQTPQSEAIPGSSQVANSSDGFSFPVDDWTRLDRFLVLGAEGGSY